MPSGTTYCPIFILHIVATGPPSWRACLSYALLFYNLYAIVHKDLCNFRANHFAARIKNAVTLPLHHTNSYSPLHFFNSPRRHFVAIIKLTELPSCADERVTDVKPGRPMWLCECKCGTPLSFLPPTSPRPTVQNPAAVSGICHGLPCIYRWQVREIAPNRHQKSSC